MADKGLTQADVMRALDENKQTINKLFKGTTQMSKPWAERLAPLLGLTWPEVMGWEGVGQGLLAKTESKPRQRLSPAILTIQEHDVSAAGGDGTSLADLDGHERHPVIGQWSLPADLLNAHVTPNMHPVIIRMVGDSMEPDFASGDRVMVDTSARAPSPPGIYVLWDGMGLIMKRCHIVLGSDPLLVEISSANPAYPTYQRPLADLRINGRVMGKWTWK